MAELAATAPLQPERDGTSPSAVGDAGAAAASSADASTEALSADASAAKSAAVPKLEDDEDCGFCGYMKAGPCGDVFTNWEDCVKMAQSKDEDFARKCIGSTKARVRAFFFRRGAPRAARGRVSRGPTRPRRRP